MPDYSKGKIYRLVDLTNDTVYIGSTIQTLERRLHDHENDYKRYIGGDLNHKITSCEIIKGGKYKIELIANFPCENKNELLKKEGEWIKNTNCLNRFIPTGECTKENKQEYNKQYGKQYRINNKEYIEKYNKDYYANNKDILSKKAREKINCECGSIINKSDIAKHKKTKKHQEYEKSK